MKQIYEERYRIIKDGEDTGRCVSILYIKNGKEKRKRLFEDYPLEEGYYLELIFFGTQK